MMIHIRTRIGRPISDARAMTLRGERSFNGRELCPACCKKLGL